MILMFIRVVTTIRSRPQFSLSPVCFAARERNLLMRSADATQVLSLGTLMTSFADGNNGPLTGVAIARALGLNPAASVDEIIGEIMRLNVKASTPPPGYVHRRQVVEALERAAAAEAAFANGDKPGAVTIAQAVSRAIGEGKIAVQSRDYYLALCRSDGGFRKFEAYTASLPSLTRTEPAPKKGRKQIDSAALAQAARDYQAARAAEGCEIDIAMAVRTITADSEKMVGLVDDLPDLPSADRTSLTIPNVVAAAMEARELQERYAAAGFSITLPEAVSVVAASRGIKP
jgi:hypothetical protein